jgi:ribosome biogenesis GTPase / thiamine phosphate phosphatase
MQWKSTMTRPSTSGGPPTLEAAESERVLAELGFSPFFRQQLSREEFESDTIGRVLEVQRSGLLVGTVRGECVATLGGHWWEAPAEQRPTVGDWVLVDPGGRRVRRVLERKSVFRRMAAGDRVDVQLIAANVDTVFIVSSCNAEFSPSRLERYLALALDAGVQTVLVLTKADLTDRAEAYLSAAREVRRDLCIELVDARQPHTLAGVRGWCQRGHTVALIGSSGVGKSTLLNTLAGEVRQSTQAISAAEDRGRHTTTHRSLHALPGGAWVLDSPGMRELGLASVDRGLARLFQDLDDLASSCRFSDCAHEDEPGCAIQAAIAGGAIDLRRLANYRKLRREEARSRETLAESRRRSRAFGRMTRKIVPRRRGR